MYNYKGYRRQDRDYIILEWGDDFLKQDTESLKHKLKV